MKDEKNDYWFPAKTYGWGWGCPRKWQGWVVTLVFIAVILFLPNVVSPETNMPTFGLIAGTVVCSFLGICIAKGEPPKWRWGKVEDK